MEVSDLNSLYVNKNWTWGDDLDVKIAELRSARLRGFLDHPRNTDLWPSLKAAKEVGASKWFVKEDAIRFETPQRTFANERPDVGWLRAFAPWKKGPFHFDGTVIDSEWKSELKWQRLLPYLPNLQDKVIADIGANNGYFMFRMAEHRPQMVLGIEPVAKPWTNFHFMQELARVPELSMEPLDVDQFAMFENTFDVIFFMGVIYHHPDPFGVLNILRRALKPGGTLVLESQGIAGKEAVALVPRGRYAHARGVYFLPTEACLENWLHRSGFGELFCFSNIQLKCDEQRSTDWAPIKSLGDFLDPNDRSLTIEGYPAPRRIYFTATRRSSTR